MLSFYFNRSEKKICSHAKRSKNLKKQQKKLQIFFCLATFTREEKISLIKKACFMLNVLNLKSFSRHIFFVVASSLSRLCSAITLYRRRWLTKLGEDKPSLNSGSNNSGVLNKRVDVIFFSPFIGKNACFWENFKSY